MRTLQKPPSKPTARKKSKPAAPARTHEEEVIANFFLGVLLCLLVVVVYYPVFTAGFVWDDDQLLTANPQVHAANGWWTLWLRPETADYFPLTSTTLWIEWRIWGLNAAGYHVTNVLMHAVAVILSWQVLKRLKIPGAWVAAAIFAVHPVCVESVAWISERKNTISQIFFLLSIIHYVRFQEKGRLWRYIAAVICFTLSLLAKTSVVMLPFILLLLAWWRYRDLVPLRESYDLEKNPVERGILPWSIAIAAGLAGAAGGVIEAGSSVPMMIAGGIGAAAVAAAIGWLIGVQLKKVALLPYTLAALGAVSGLAGGGAIAYALKMPIIPEFLLALAGTMILGGCGVVAGYYIRKVNLWNRFAGFEVIRAVPFFLAAGLLGAVTIYFQYGKAIGSEEIPLGNLWQRMASACFATGFYLYSAMWPFNIVEIYPQWHRAFSILMTMPTPHMDHGDPDALPYYLQVIPGIVIAALLVYCWVRRSESWARALLVGLGCYILGMLPALGLLKMSYMRLTLVADHFQYISIIAVIALVVSAGFNRAMHPGWLAVAAGAFAFITWENWPATQDNHFEQFVWIGGSGLLALVYTQPELWKAAWGTLLVAVIGCCSYMSYFQADTYHNEESLWSATLAKNPNSWQAHNHLGAALYMRHDYKGAYPHFAAAVRLKPENPESHNNLALVLALFGQMDEAVKQYEIAVHIKDDASMDTNLANAYASVKRYDDAIRMYKHAIELSGPNGSPSAECNLGYLLLQQGRLDEAIPHFMKAVEVDPTMEQGTGDLTQALKMKGIDPAAPAVTGSYSFDANKALQLLHEAAGRVEALRQQEGQ
jgi:tetratricopeptide (TPR) repeat protein